MSEGLADLPIMSLHTGTELGRAAHPIIDPGRLQIPAFYCEGPLIEFQPAVLHTADIREFSNIGLIVDSVDDIMPLEGLVRLQPVIDSDFQLEGKMVVQEDGPKLGKVVDYIIDTESFFILKIHVRPTMLQSFKTAEFIIDRNQIARLTDDAIYVKKPSVKDEARKPLPLHAFHNPFRRPQAEASHSTSRPK